MRVVGSLFCHSFSSPANAISGTLPLRRVLTAVQFGDMRPGLGSSGSLAGNSHGDWFGVLFWRCGLTIGSCLRRVLAGLGFACTFSEGKTQAAALCSQNARRHPHTHTITHTQLMPTLRSRNVLVVSPRNAVSRVCIFLYMSSYIAGRRYPSSISFKFRLNYTCGVLQSFNHCCHYLCYFFIVTMLTSVTIVLKARIFLPGLQPRLSRAQKHGLKGWVEVVIRVLPLISKPKTQNSKP